MIRMSPEQFEELVAEALDQLPEEFADLLDNVVVQVEEEPSADDLAEVGMEPDEEGELFGIYHGVNQLERGFEYSALPDRIAIFRGPILRACASRREVVREVRDTVIHELGHYFGMEEDQMPY
ncbi:MAG TPA: metallopeptidase family protein [Thermoanaerobaculia bacterium]|nr:metallopeptidase family protein [Thermoanaerobaculia bacterium]